MICLECDGRHNAAQGNGTARWQCQCAASWAGNAAFVGTVLRMASCGVASGGRVVMLYLVASSTVRCANMGHGLSPQTQSAAVLRSEHAPERTPYSPRGLSGVRGDTLPHNSTWLLVSVHHSMRPRVVHCRLCLEVAPCCVYMCGG